MREQHEPQEQHEESEPRNEVVARAEMIYLRSFSLKGMTVRTDRVSGRRRLSYGPDCEDGMASYRWIESRRRQPDEE